MIQLLLLFSCSVVSNSLRLHGLQYARLPCPWPSPGVCSSSCQLSLCCHPTISSSVAPFSSCLQILCNIKVFSSELALLIRWPKYWSFSFNISNSNEYSRLISFRIDWFDLSSVQESSPAPQFRSIGSLVLSLPPGPTLTSVQDYWKNHSFDYTEFCWQSDVSDF